MTQLHSLAGSFPDQSTGFGHETISVQLNILLTGRGTGKIKYIGGHYFSERNGTEWFRHIIPRNRTIAACTPRSNQTIQTELKSMYTLYFLFGSYHW